MEQRIWNKVGVSSVNQQNRARLLISCPDKSGIVSAVSRFLSEQGANIVQSDQYSMDPAGGLFFMRIEFYLNELSERLTAIQSNFAAVAEPFAMSWRMYQASRKKRLAIFVSKEEHCLIELLWQWHAGDLNADIVLIVSNHPHMKPIAESFGIPFRYIPVMPDRKAMAELEQMEAVEAAEVDVIILARYMQIISPKFIKQYRNRIINIHHSFLPAFVGGKPYAQAHLRGVKLIGATAHYVTEELDGGPIIEQDIHRVSHRHNVEDLKRIGRQVERMVLARAVVWYIEDRIIVHENKTVVFN